MDNKNLAYSNHYSSNFSLSFNNSQCTDYKFFLNFANSNKWALWCARLIFAFLLIYLNLGMAKIEEIFMVSIENITNKTVKFKVKNHDGIESVYEKRIWPHILANLTIRAFGSNCFEILFPIIETFSFSANDATIMGVYVIIGTSVFNLLITTAISLYSLPGKKTLKIDGYALYINFAICSVLTWGWLLIALNLISPSVIEIWEASILLLIYVVLLLVSCLVNKHLTRMKTLKNLNKSPEISNNSHSSYDLAYEDLDKLPVELRESEFKRKKIIKLIEKLDKSNIYLTDFQKLKLVQYYFNKIIQHSYLYHKIKAIRILTGSKIGSIRLSDELKEIFQKIDHDLFTFKNRTSSYNLINEQFLYEDEDDLDYINENNNSNLDDRKALIEFSSRVYEIKTNQSKCIVTLTRSINLDIEVFAVLRTINGSMSSFKEYSPLKNTIIKFDPNETVKEIPIFITQNVTEGNDFFVNIETHKESFNLARLGKNSYCMVVVKNGKEEAEQEIEFLDTIYEIQNNDSYAYLKLIRKNSSLGEAKINFEIIINDHKFEYEELNAFRGFKQEIHFKNGEKEKLYRLRIASLFSIMSEKLGVRLVSSENSNVKIGTRENAIIFLRQNRELKIKNELILTKLKSDRTGSSFKKLSILDQFKNSLNVNNGDIENSNLTDHILHIFSFGWKIFYSFIPPPEVYNGLLSFFISLSIIILLIYLILVVSTLFSCLIGMPVSVILIVYTSLFLGIPRALASRISVLNEKTANNSIGFIQFFSTINVCLGLGLPWLFYSIYSNIKKTPFYLINANNLTYPIVAFICLNTVFIIGMVMKRNLKVFKNAELSGSIIQRRILSLVLVILWILFVTLISLQIFYYN